MGAPTMMFPDGCPLGLVIGNAAIQNAGVVVTGDNTASHGWHFIDFSSVRGDTPLLVDVLDAANSIIDAVQERITPNGMLELLQSFSRGYRFALTSPSTHAKDCSPTIAQSIKCASNGGRKAVALAMCIADGAVLNRGDLLTNTGPSDHAALMVAYDAYVRARSRHLLLVKPLDIAKRADAQNGFLLLCSTPDARSQYIVLDARRVTHGPTTEQHMRKAGRSGALVGTSSGLGIHFVFTEHTLQLSHVIDANFAYAHGVMLARLHVAIGNPVNAMATWIDDVAKNFADRLFGHLWCKEFVSK